MERGVLSLTFLFSRKEDAACLAPLMLPCPQNGWRLRTIFLNQKATLENLYTLLPWLGELFTQTALQQNAKDTCDEMK